MIKNILKKFFPSHSKKELDKIKPIINQINKYFIEYKNLKGDQEIKNKTEEFKKRIKDGESLDDILPEAFGLLKRSCQNLKDNKQSNWFMIPFDVQLLGGIILHKGKIAEMKTGEGKTLVATLPAYLNSLSGKPVHIVTVNDYLANRDRDEMSELYDYLGVSSGSITKKVDLSKREEIYKKDIVYIENSELGFDYLRDNLTKSLENRTLMKRGLNYCIIDEIDSILIDEARTPLIISQEIKEKTNKYIEYKDIVKQLIPSKTEKKVSKGFLKEYLEKTKNGNNIQEEKEDKEGDYYIDLKHKTALLSHKGIKKLEKLLKVNNLYSDLGFEEIHFIENALKAQSCYKKDVDYIVQKGNVLLIDGNTGRVTPGRRFSEGLHQALEAKEGVEIKNETKTVATITYQNFFKLYNKLSGMTGTAITEGEEFDKIYGLDVIEINTNKPIIRVDNIDSLYFNSNTKWLNIINTIKFYHSMGQPILIGTSNILTSEYVSNLLNKEKLIHNVLNAKLHEQESLIIKNAGNFGSIMVATNMAGRGTDIKLEKNLNKKISDKYVEWIKNNIYSIYGFSFQIHSEIEKGYIKESLDKIWNGKGKKWIDYISLENQGNGKYILKVGVENLDKEKLNTEKNIKYLKQFYGNLIDLYFGLFILGTEKHESRRIDNQLRGRSGRQGDPGVSKFYVSFDDDLLRKMGGNKVKSLASMIIPKDELEIMELKKKQFTSSIDRSQKQIEGWYFGIRKHLFDYDSVIDKQRKMIYKERDEILYSINDFSYNNIEQFDNKIYGFLEIMKNEIDITFRDFGFDSTLSKISKRYGINLDKNEKWNGEKIILSIKHHLKNIKKIIGKENSHKLFNEIYLNSIDTFWINHIDTMNLLREKVSLMGYAQIDPLVMYKEEAYKKFVDLKNDIRNNFLKHIITLQINVKEKKEVEVNQKEEEMIKKTLDMISKNILKKENKKIKQNKIKKM